MFFAYRLVNLYFKEQFQGIYPNWRE